ncbi:globin domain-containing protein [Paludibaculum fermentans]|uniref:Hemin receptor n=1 Tax=Paludibaculum fermentans TaxID=1473598 RepID=A0A7S7SNR9_PALFE|nr:globin domain-containing protein [Paludibaculum fermentans]QOY91208.1 hemin receptor [Paludibaculum fermentans]
MRREAPVAHGLDPPRSHLVERPAREIEVLRGTFAKVKLSPEQAGAKFYARLFELAPQVRPMFPAAMGPQAGKLFQTLKLLVASLDRLHELVPVLRELGRRHKSYGAVADHYAVVGSALIWTLEQELGDEFTEEAKEDWIQLYTLVSRMMEAD